MPLLLVNNVVRFALNQTLYGRDVVNVIDYRLTPGSVSDRAAMALSQAKIIATSWRDTVLNRQVDELSFNSVSWVDLDNAAGSVGSSSAVNSGTALPRPGGTTSAGLPPNVALLARKEGTVTRSSRPGRLFISGIVEQETGADAGHQLVSTSVGAWNTALSTFLDDTTTPAGAGVAFVSEMVVVHDGATPTATTVTSLTVDNLLATQKRRLRG